MNVLTDQEKLKDYDRLRKEVVGYKERLRAVYNIAQLSEDLGQNNKVAKLIIEEAFTPKE